MTVGARREVLFEEWTEEEFLDRLTTYDVSRTARSTNVTSSGARVLDIAVASGEQLRIVSYKWYQEDGSPTRARLFAAESTSAYSSIVERDYLDQPGEQEHAGNGWQEPYQTIDFHADGSLTVKAFAESGGAQATIDSVAFTLHAMRVSRLDERRL